MNIVLPTVALVCSLLLPPVALAQAFQVQNYLKITFIDDPEGPSNQIEVRGSHIVTLLSTGGEGPFQVETDGHVDVCLFSSCSACGPMGVGCFKSKKLKNTGDSVACTSNGGTGLCNRVYRALLNYKIDGAPQPTNIDCGGPFCN